MKEHIESIADNALLAEDQLYATLELVDVINFYLINKKSGLYSYYHQNVPASLNTIKSYLDKIDGHIETMILFAQFEIPREKQILNKILFALGIISTPVAFSTTYVKELAAIVSKDYQNKNETIVSLVDKISNSLVTNVHETKDDPLSLLVLLALHGQPEAKLFFAKLLYRLVSNYKNGMDRNLFDSARQCAITLFTTFADNNADAAHQLARLYDPFFMGLNHNNYDEACRWYDTAQILMNRNNPNYIELCSNHGIALWHTCQQSIQLPAVLAYAINLIDIAASNGNAEAEFILGELYFYGKIPPGVNIEQAIVWYEAAAKQDVFNAHTKLADLLPRFYREKQGYKHYLKALQIASENHIPTGFTQELINHYNKSFTRPNSGKVKIPEPWKKAPPSNTSMAQIVAVINNQNCNDKTPNTDNKENLSNNIPKPPG